MPYMITSRKNQPVITSVDNSVHFVFLQQELKSASRLPFILPLLVLFIDGVPIHELIGHPLITKHVLAAHADRSLGHAVEALGAAAARGREGGAAVGPLKSFQVLRRGGRGAVRGRAGEGRRPSGRLRRRRRGRICRPGTGTRKIGGLLALLALALP